MDFMAFIKEYAPLFVTNPVAMLSTLAVGVASGFWLGKQLAKSQLDGKDGRITGFEDRLKAAQSTIDDLKERLSDAHKRLGIESSVAHKYTAMTGPELKKCAKNVADDLRKLSSTYRDETVQFGLSASGGGATASQHERRLARDREYIQLNRVSQEMMATYSRRFQVDVVMLYQEMRKRGASLVGSAAALGFNESLLDNPVNALGIDFIVRALESMAGTLPS
ncbi:hypothetical protein [Burkholderia gladioli]|uniref:hypothetical protein n=1 Tax=Burkholderia gladioli TaxID=28095 RepID=UPI0016417FA7|nr:hypothetical protein [Burkholderia gladioli]